MPRIGHKEGCQCVVCKAMQAKELREGAIQKSQVPENRIPVGTLAPGSKFTYQAVRKFIRYGTDKGKIVAVEIASGEIIRLDENILVLRELTEAEQARSKYEG